MLITTILAALVVATPADTAKGILAVRGHMKHVSPSIARIVAEEAARVVALPGNTWITPAQLIGLAITESDLRWWLNQTDRRGSDCGICQNRVSVPSVYPACKRRGWRCWKRACRRLTNKATPRVSIRRSMALAMHELNGIRAKWCCGKTGGPKCRCGRWSPKSRLRCTLASFNQGPRYACSRRRRTCKPLRGVWENKSGYTARVRRCKARNRYWLKAVCFARAVELARKPRWSCRYARSLRWIRRAFRRAAKVATVRR